MTAVSQRAGLVAGHSISVRIDYHICSPTHARTRMHIHTHARTHKNIHMTYGYVTVGETGAFCKKNSVKVTFCGNIFRYIISVNICI